MRSTFPLEVGMLTVSEILPQGPAKDKLQAGDILTRINGKLLTQFVPLETVLDDHVGKSVRIIPNAISAQIGFIFACDRLKLKLKGLAK